MRTIAELLAVALAIAASMLAPGCTSDTSASPASEVSPAEPNLPAEAPLTPEEREQCEAFGFGRDMVIAHMHYATERPEACTYSGTDQGGSAIGSNGRYVTMGWVDVPNSYGGVDRYTWSIQVDKSSGKWEAGEPLVFPK